MLPLPSYNYLRGPAQGNLSFSHPHSTGLVLRSGLRAVRSVIPSPTVVAAASTNESQGWYQEDGSSGENLLKLFREKQPGENRS